MDCRECLNILNEYIDGELAAQYEEPLKAHLDSCPECSRQYKQLLDIKKSISALPEEDVPQSLVKRVKTAKRKDSFMRKAYIASTAAAVFFAGIFALSSLGLINLPARNSANGIDQKSGQPEEYCTDANHTVDDGWNLATPGTTIGSLSYRFNVDTKNTGAPDLEQAKQMLGGEIIAQDTLLVEVNKNNINELNELIKSGVFSLPASQISIAEGCKVTIVFQR